MESAEFLSTHAFYPHLASYYYTRRRPIYGQVSSILSSQDDKSIEYIIDAVEAGPLFLMFDGAISHRTSSDPLFRKRTARLAVPREIGVGVSAQQRGGMAGLCDDVILSKWKSTISPGEATRMGHCRKHLGGACACITP